MLNKRPEYEEEEAHSAEEVFVNDGHIEQDQNIITKDSTISSLKIDLLHKRFAHTNVASIKELIRCGACDGLERITHQQASPNTYHCEACSMAKATKHSRDPSKKAKRNLTAVSKELYFQAVYTDLIGPMQVRAPGGFYYGITFTELTSRFRYFYPLRRKSDALNAFKQLVAEVEADGFKIKLLKSDNGGEYVSEDFKTYCAQEKIVQRFTSPHTPQSNSISERFNRVLGEKCRAMLIGANLPMSLWAECMKTATYISNRVISPTHRCKTPYELIYGAKPDVSHLRAFGCIAYFYNFDIDRRKLDNKAHKGVLVGYDLQSASYLVYSPESRTVRKTGHVLFNEHLLYYTTPCKDIEVMDMDNLEQPSNRVKDNALPTNKQLATTTTTVAAAEAPPNSTPLRKSTRARQQPDRLAFSAEECAYSVETLLHGADDFEFPDEDFDSEAGDAPANLRDIYKRSDQTEWFAAIDSENKSLFKHGVFEVVESVPAGKNLVKARYIFKRKGDGRYKARLVAKGYSQIKGVDYNEVFAPVVGKINLRALLSLAAVEDWDIYQMDVKTAFLHGELDEEIYMLAPEGMLYPKGTILKLKKSLYGLKQAPRQWHKALDGFIKSKGFTRCHIDQSIYVRGSGSTATIIAVYVDDILVFGHDNVLISQFKTELNSKFQIEDLGQVKNILGMEVQRDRVHKTITLSQKKYLINLISKFRMDKSKPRKCSVPISKSMYSSTTDKTSKSAQPTQLPYRSALGGILYANVCCRPDISFAVSTLASHCESPKGVHWNALMDLLRYLKDTQDLALVYGRADGSAKNTLNVYADADYARDTEKRRSRSGYVIYLNGGAVAWNSSLQSVVAGSTSEAELYAMYSAVQQAYNLKHLLGELGFVQPILPCFEDNTGTIDWIVNQRASSRMKAIEVKYYWLRDTKDDGSCDYIHIQTKFQKADVFTKPMDFTEYIEQVKMLYNIPI